MKECSYEEVDRSTGQVVSVDCSVAAFVPIIPCTVNLSSTMRGKVDPLVVHALATSVKVVEDSLLSVRR